jgi:hypothetical protein
VIRLHTDTNGDFDAKISFTMMDFLLNVFLFLLGLGIGVKYERWLGEKVKTRSGHSRFQETGFQDSRYQKSSSFKNSTSAKSAGSKKGSNSRFHIS